MKGKRILLFSLLFVLTVFFTVPAFAKTKLKLNKKTVTIAPKQVVKLTVKVKGEKKKAKWKKAKWKNIKWSSSNKKIATVSKTGEVKGRKAGKVVIKAKVKGKTLKCKVTVSPLKRKKPGSVPTVQSDGKTTFTFIQKGWYVARLEVQVWDKQKQDLVWRYSDSCAIGQTKKLSIDTNRYEINRVGYQIWFFGWDNDYMNLPWSNTDYALTFTLSGSGDFPEFTW